MSFAQLRSRPIYNPLSSSSVVLPTVSTGGATVYDYSASVASTMTSDGGGAVTERGVVWSLSSNPTTSDTKVTGSTSTGTYSSQITGLNPYTTYHVRAFATNSAGTSYGDDVLFTTTTHPRYGFISYNAGVF